MSERKPRIPKCRLHKPTGQAVVTLSGKDFYLGRYGSLESKAEYDRILAEWLASGRQVTNGAGEAPADLTVVEMIRGYMSFAGGYYRKDAKPTSEVANIKLAMRPLKELYGHTVAKDFGPLALKTVRQAMIDADLSRGEVNKRVSHVVRCFKWAAENELVPASVHHGLKTVSGLRKGRSAARELPPVKPVPDVFVDAIQPHVAPQIWAMIDLQRLSGMRPGEVVLMRTCDLDTSGKVWEYIPERHKTEHHNRERRIFLGPQAQAVLRPWLRTNLQEYLFSPVEVLEAFYARRRAERKSPQTPSSRARKRVKRRERAPHEHYTTQSYGRAIVVGCKTVGVPTWTPNRLRHNAATRLRKEYGLDIARVILGHASQQVTEVYAEVDREKAIKVMGEIG
jgi:integrase